MLFATLNLRNIFLSSSLGSRIETEKLFNISFAINIQNWACLLQVSWWETRTQRGKKDDVVSIYEFAALMTTMMVSSFDVKFSPINDNWKRAHVLARSTALAHSQWGDIFDSWRMLEMFHTESSQNNRYIHIYPQWLAGLTELTLNVFYLYFDFTYSSSVQRDIYIYCLLSAWRRCRLSIDTFSLLIKFALEIYPH